MNNILEKKISVLSILKFVLPTIIMMVVMSLYTVVDGMFVSRLISTNAFSAVNIMYPLLSFTIGLGMMFGTGITAIVSRKLGEGKGQEANENFTFIICFTTILGILLSCFCLLFLKPIIFCLGANETVFEYCYAYAWPLIFFFFANILQFQFQNIYVANGKPSIGLALTIVGGVTNIILDYVFIAICKMGISGAALATGIGYLIPAIFGICYFSFFKKGTIHFVKPKWNIQVLWNTMTNGSSEMVSYLSTSVTTLLFNIIMMKLVGENGVAAIAILLYLDFILVAINMGYSIGIAPLFSYHYGSQQFQKVKQLYRISVRFCLTIGIAMTSFAMLFASILTQFFVSPGSEVYALAVVGLRIFSFSYLCKGMNIFSSAMFTAFGNGKVSAVVSFLRTLVFLVLSLLVCSYLFGVNGVWIATPIAELLACIVVVWCTWINRKTYYLY